MQPGSRTGTSAGALRLAGLILISPLAWRYGLYSVPPVMESVASLYDRLLDQLLLPPLVKRMEYVLSDAIARQDSKAAYDALHVYLLLNLDKDHEDKQRTADPRLGAERSGQPRQRGGVWRSRRRAGTYRRPV